MNNKIILGTAQFGMKYGVANKKGKIKSKEIFKILNYLKKINIKFLDTAYSYGVSEEEIGKYYKTKKTKFNIITKLSFKNNKEIVEQYISSLKKLGYPPKIILAHSSKDYLNPEFHKAMKFLKSKYPISKIGVSLYKISEIKQILKYKKPDYLQIPINIFDQRFVDKKIINIIKKKSIKIIGRSVFLQGLFFKNRKFIFKNFKNVKSKYDKLSKVANIEKMNLGQLSLNWTYNLKEIDLIIIGIDSLKHLKENLKIINKNITSSSKEIIKNTKFNDNKIIKPYLWKIK